MGSDLTVKYLNFKAVLCKGCGKIGQPDRLGPDGGLVEIPDRWLDEENFHGMIFTAEGGAKKFLELRC